MVRLELEDSSYIEPAIFVICSLLYFWFFILFVSFNSILVVMRLLDVGLFKVKTTIEFDGLWMN